MHYYELLLFLAFKRGQKVGQLEFELFYYPLANEVAKGYSNATFRNILQWILTKLGTYLVLKRIWNPIDFQGHTGFPFGR